MRKSWGLVAVLSGMALAVPGVAMAEEIPAGQGEASAVAAEVDGIVSAGETEAKSGSSEAEATGNALTLGGEPPSEQFGGTTKSTGDSNASGNLLDTGDTPLGRLQVTPWEATTRAPSAATSNCRTATGKAAVARLTLIDKDTLDVNVLQSQSDAAHCGLTSTGAGSSDGVTVGLGGEGGLFLTLLHSEAATGKQGKTYLISINGNEIANNEQAGGQCAIEVPGLLGLTCLTVGGGTGTVFADVADLTVGDGALTAGLVGTSATPDKAGASVLPETIEPAPAPADDGMLPRTGLEIGALAMLGAGMASAGEAMRRRFRRR